MTVSCAETPRERQGSPLPSARTDHVVLRLTQPVVLVSTSDTGVMSSSRSAVNLADLWLARLELEPLGGDERPGARWWPWVGVILRVSGVVACAWLWSRVRGRSPRGEQDVGLTLAQDGDDRAGRRLVDAQRESVLLPASAGTAPSSTRAPRRSTGTHSCTRGPSWRSGSRSTTVCLRRGVRRLTVQFRPGDSAYAVEQLDWMRAQLFGQPPGRPPGGA